MPKASGHQLGPFSLEHPFILAPMAGITDSPFRRFMRRHGASLVVSELVSANGLHYGGEKTLVLLKYEEEERPLGLQIFGEDVENICSAARKIEELKADFVDLNMGCPVPKVVKKGGGSAMCRDTVALSKILTQLVKSVKIPVTIKIRSGWDEGSKNALEVARVAEDAGVTWVAIHGRTRAQGYSGQADWDAIGNVKAKVGIPIIGNGDVGSADQGPTSAMSRLKTYGVDGVMIGRAVLRNPFLFEQCRAAYLGEAAPAVTPERYLEMIRELKVLYESSYVERLALIQARKFLGWFSSGFPGCHEFRRHLFSIPDPETIWAEAERFFASATVGRDLGFLNEPFLMGGHG